MKTYNQPQHTQGEWKQQDGIISNESRMIAQVNSRGIMKDEFIANAQRIVKAVNMYEELINIMSEINEEADLTDTGAEISFSLLDRIQKLLKEAEQK